jgi:hypothetical protein
MSAVLGPAPALSPGLEIVEHLPGTERRIIAALADRWHRRERALLSGIRARLLERALVLPHRGLVALGRHSVVTTLVVLLGDAFVLANTRPPRDEFATMAAALLAVATAYLGGWGISSRVSVRLRQRYKRAIRLATYMRYVPARILILFAGAGGNERLLGLQVRLWILTISEAALLVTVSPLVRVVAALAFALGWLVEITDDETAHWRGAVSRD